ncbi:MAG: carboxymuconolactone decarboxylase family protein [Gemmatimonadota bacterium]|nr:MAG: carboxymuconolactone decarboxylase family protein [Gemmatimonadota bacterium]
MSRIPYIGRENFTEAQQRLFENITGGKRGKGRPLETFLTPEGGLRGPFNALLYSPAIGDATQRLGEVVRFESSLSPRLRELAILTVVAYWNAQYAWSSHRKIARREGLDEHLIESLEKGVRPHFENPTEALIYNFAREVIDKQRVSDRVYNEAVALLGEAGVVDLVILLGYYTMVSMILTVFEVPVPTGESSP